MKNICLFIHLDLPIFPSRYSFFNIGNAQSYFDEKTTTSFIKKYAEECILPLNEQILTTINRTYGNFKVIISASGFALETIKKVKPEVIESFKRLVKTGNIEFCANPYYESYASLFDINEFVEQVKLQSNYIEKIFKTKPTIFRNTDLIHSEEIQRQLLQLDISKFLIDRKTTISTPNNLYVSNNQKTFIINEELSREFTSSLCTNHWLNSDYITNKILNSTEGDLVNIQLSYSSFSCISDPENPNANFLINFGRDVLKNPVLFFGSTNDTIKYCTPKANFKLQNSNNEDDEISINTPDFLNDMQSDALKKLYFIKYALMSSGNKKQINNWRKLQHFTLIERMSKDTLVMKNFKHYSIPYYHFDDEYINFMNIINDLEIHINSLIQNSLK